MTIEKICVFMLFASLVFLIKAIVTYRNHEVILDAIFKYQFKCIMTSGFSNKLVEYDDCEDIDKTLLRLWDWGYKRILSPVQFDVIKPYIGMKMPELTKLINKELEEKKGAMKN